MTVGWNLHRAWGWSSPLPGSSFLSACTGSSRQHPDAAGGSCCCRQCHGEGAASPTPAPAGWYLHLPAQGLVPCNQEELAGDTAGDTPRPYSCQGQQLGKGATSIRRGASSPRSKRSELLCQPQLPALAALVHAKRGGRTWVGAHPPECPSGGSWLSFHPERQHEATDAGLAENGKAALK